MKSATRVATRERTLFGRTSYKKIVESLALEAMAVEPMQAPGLANPPPEAGGYMYNTLEGIAAILFLTQRALKVLTSGERFDKARDHLGSVFLAGLERQYSKAEMQSLVVPLLEQRHLEYEAILDGTGNPGVRLRQLGSAIVDHIVEDEVDDVRANLATMFLVSKLMIEPGKRLKAMDEAGKIKW